VATRFAEGKSFVFNLPACRRQVRVIREIRGEKAKW
jgi:hypothetical protein